MTHHDMSKPKETHKVNRMIKLFQQRSDQAYEKYLLVRSKAAESHGAVNDTGEWQAAIIDGARLKAQYEVWSKAAELLRKEELNK